MLRGLLSVGGDLVRCIVLVNRLPGATQRLSLSFPLVIALQALNKLSALVVSRCSFRRELGQPLNLFINLVWLKLVITWLHCAGLLPLAPGSGGVKD